MINKIEFKDEDSDDVMCRLHNESSGYTLTIITAAQDVLQEDGPVVNQISNDEVIVIYSLEYVMQKMSAAYEKNHEEFGEMAHGIGFSYLVNEAMRVDNERLTPDTND